MRVAGWRIGGEMWPLGRGDEGCWMADWGRGGGRWGGDEGCRIEGEMVAVGEGMRGAGFGSRWWPVYVFSSDKSPPIRFITGSVGTAGLYCYRGTEDMRRGYG